MKMRRLEIYIVNNDTNIVEFNTLDKLMCTE